MDSGRGKDGLVYRRILLKLSGEALAGENKFGFKPSIISRIAEDIKEVLSLGVQIGLVVGGGNIFRGGTGTALGIERCTGDTMGMLATVINSLALQDLLEKAGVSVRVMTAIEMRAVAEPFVRKKAIQYLEKGRVVIFSAGTGSPFFTTDTAAALKAVEIGADALLKATRVDGVYDGDPEKDGNAKKIDSISYLDVIQRRLRIMDLTAVSLCMDNGLPVLVFNLFREHSIKRIVTGEKTGTIIS